MWFVIVGALTGIAVCGMVRDLLISRYTPAFFWGVTAGVGLGMIAYAIARREE